MKMFEIGTLIYVNFGIHFGVKINFRVFLSYPGIYSVFYSVPAKGAPGPCPLKYATASPDGLRLISTCTAPDH